MIPKIIHYCWLSDDPFPASIKKCMDSWKILNSEYEFILWDRNRFNIEDVPWVKQAFESKKYAFAADYIRLYALYNYGGIYLDTDVEVVKKFDDLLDLPYFIGTEGEGHIEAGVIGAEKGMNWIKVCLKHYDNRNFIKDNGTLDIVALPRVMRDHISNIMKIKFLNMGKDVISRGLFQSNLYLFPFDYFCSKDFGTGLIHSTINTYTIHHFAGSWHNQKAINFRLSLFKKRLISVFGEKLILKIVGFLKLRKIKEFLSK